MCGWPSPKQSQMSGKKQVPKLEVPAICKHIACVREYHTKIWHSMEPVPPFSDTVPAMGPLQLEGRDTGARVHPGWDINQVTPSCKPMWPCKNIHVQSGRIMEWICFMETSQWFSGHRCRVPPTSAAPCRFACALRQHQLVEWPQKSMLSRSKS